MAFVENIFQTLLPNANGSLDHFKSSFLERLPCQSTNIPNSKQDLIF